MLRNLLPALIGWICLLPGAFPDLAAQDAPSKQDIQKQMEEVQKGKEASTQKAEATRLYEKALEDLKAAQGSTGNAAEFKREYRGSADKEKALDREIAVGVELIPVVAPEGASVATLRRRTNVAEAARKELEKLLGSHEAIKDGWEDRLKEIRTRLPELKSMIEDMSRGLGEREGPRTIVEKASRVAALCELEKLRREQEELVAEQEALEGRLELLPKDRSAVQLRLEAARTAEKAWQGLTRKAIEEESKKSAEKAAILRNQAIVERFEDLKEIATLNEFWAKEGGRLAADLESSRQDVAAMTGRRSRLQRRFNSIHQMISVVGLNNSTVELIRKEAEALPEVKKLQHDQRLTQQRIAEIMLQEYTVERVLEGATDQKRRIQSLIELHKDEVKGLDSLMLTAVASSLIQQQDKLAGSIGMDLASLRGRLWTLDRESRLLIETTSEFGDYLEERILWVPSIPRKRLFNLDGAGEAAAWLFSPSQWYEAISMAGAEFAGDWGSHLLPFLLFFVILLLSPLLGRRLVAVGEKVTRPRADRYRLTWEALILTVLLGLPIPLLAWGFESLLHASTAKGSFGQGIASTLDHLNTFLLMVSITIQALRPGGLCQVHFKWPAAGVAELQRTIRRFLRWVLPFFLFAGILNTCGRQEWIDSLGRIIFTLGVGIYSYLLFQAIRPSGKLIGPYLRRNPERWFSKNKYVWYVMVSGSPLLFILLGLFGYYLTARRLAQGFHASLWAFVLVLVGFSLAQRWIRLSVKRAGIRHSDRRKAELAAQEQSGEEAELVESDFEKLDLEAVRSKTSQLFRAMAMLAFIVTFLAIWSDVMPALKMFGRIQLLPTPAILEQSLDDSLAQKIASPAPEPESQDGSESTSKTPMISPVPPMPSTTTSTVATAATQNLPKLTLSQLLLFLISMGFTVLGVRNLPTLVDIVLLQRLRLDPGARVAFKTLVQYVVVAIGVVSMAGALNLHWSDIQWLVAALTFGLAFGLQEIFANFISGLILLFERPIRVGDIVTVGTTSGTVTKVRLRATLIRDFDKKELLVPNKEFITTRLVNWTLSDTVVRLKVPIAVTVDADVGLVRRILEEIAAEAEDALEEPPPRILCTSIDEGVVRFEMWIFTNDRTNRPGLKDQMYSLIRKRFEAEEIQIARPQSELFIRRNPKRE